MSKYKTSIDHFNELLEFHKKYDRSPSYNSSDPKEKRLYSWIQSIKMAKRGKGTARCPDWLDKEAEKYGISDWFLVLDKAKEQFKKLISFYLKHNRKPKRYNATSPQEKKLSHWVYHMRQQRAKKSEVYPDWMDKEAEKHGILDWFVKKNKQTESEE